jgi:hypothetical protein
MKTSKKCCLLLANVVLLISACNKKDVGMLPAPAAEGVGHASLAKGNQPPAIPDTMHIGSVVIGSLYNGVGKYSPFYGYPKYNYVSEQASVLVYDQHNTLLGSVSITGNWSGCYTSTGATGSGSVKGSNYIPTSCTSTFTATNVSRAGYVYKPSANVVSSGSKIYP